MSWRAGRSSLVLLLMVIFLVGCKAENGNENKSLEERSKEEPIYLLNFKPESDSTWKHIAQVYENETGKSVKIVTPDSGIYDSTLRTELERTNPPAIFQINGAAGYEKWKEYCLDLSNTELYQNLADANMAVKNGNEIYGVPYVVEGYGIIYNDAIMKKYFSLPDKAVDISSAGEISTFSLLKKVVEDMTVKKSKLGIKGVFSSTSFFSGENWRWDTHLANIPVYYEFRDEGVADKENLEFKYASNFKNIFDLYINNSCAKPNMLSSRTVKDSMGEFAAAKTAMVQNGNWSWSQISEAQGSIVKQEDVKFLPIYTGIKGEEKQGLCIGTENYFSINNQIKKEKQNDAIAFLEWLFLSDAGKAYVTNELKFIAPFQTFSDADQPNDPLSKQVVKYMNDKSKNSVAWSFTSFPSETFKIDLGNRLLKYARGEKKWDDLIAETKVSWVVEREFDYDNFE